MSFFSQFENPPFPKEDGKKTGSAATKRMMISQSAIKPFKGALPGGGGY